MSSRRANEAEERVQGLAEQLAERERLAGELEVKATLAAADAAALRVRCEEAEEYFLRRVRVRDRAGLSPFTCPLARVLMTDPVFAADKQTYDRRAIEEWLSTRDTSPLTHHVLEHKRLTPNALASQMCFAAAHETYAR